MISVWVTLAFDSRRFYPIKFLIERCMLVCMLALACTRASATVQMHHW